MATTDEQAENESSTRVDNAKEMIQMEVDTSRFAKVLLIGATGSGKSTFINYLTNYFKGGTLDQMKVAIPSKNFPQETEGYTHSENNITNAGQSQTDKCRQYLFVDNKKEDKKYIFIDTPGLGDTRGIPQDDTNIDKIQAAVSDLRTLTAVIIVMNGTNVRVDMSMRRVLSLLAGSLPDVVMQSVILILTNTKSHAVNFNPSILPLYGSTIYVFTMNNSAFSKPAESRKDSEIESLQNDWNDSIEEIKAILTQIDMFTDVATDKLDQMKTLRDAIRTKMHGTLLEIREIQEMQQRLNEYENKFKEYGEDKVKFKNYIQSEKIVRKTFVPSSTLNTVCSSCHVVCHKNCQLNEIRCAGDQLFVHCVVMDQYEHRCSKCTNRCSFTKHYHTRNEIEEVELTQEKILYDIKTKYDDAETKLQCVQEEILSAKQTKEKLDRCIEEKCKEVQTTCKELKRICQGFNIVGELCAIVEQLLVESDQLQCVDERTKTKEYILDLQMFCDRLQKGENKTKDYAKPKIIYKSQEVDEAVTHAPLPQPSRDKTDEAIAGIHTLLIGKKESNVQPPSTTVASNAQPPSTTIASNAQPPSTTVALNVQPLTHAFKESSAVNYYVDSESSDNEYTSDRSNDEFPSYIGETDSITIYHLPNGMTKNRIATTLSRCGPIRIHYKNGNPNGPNIWIDYRRSLAKITFEDIAAAYDAIRRFDNKLFGCSTPPKVTVVASLPSWKRR